LRALKNLIVIIIAAALCAGILIFVLNEQGNGGTGAPVTSGSVIINEFMASNGGCLIDDKGDNSDWIEIYNPNSEAVNLSGMGLSDDKTSVKWAFPGVTLEAGGYLVVFASGNSQTDSNGAVHTNFKLSADGGGIYLTDSAGKTIDEIEYDNQVKNVSAGRQVDDISVWTTFDSPTPGYANDETGVQAFQASRYAADSTLLITEVMASNQTTLADNNGIYSDYIEIYNAGAEPVNLAGYGLSDDPQNVLDWKFPDVTIQPGAYLVVFASGIDSKATDLEKGAIHTGFGISSYEEMITLASPTGLILDQVMVSESQADMAYARTLGEGSAYADEWAATGKPTPGFSNTDDGYQQFLTANPLALGDIVISEVMTSNSQFLAEDNGETYDWIELYNRGSQTVNLAGYGLTDNTGNPAKFRMPDKTIAPGEYYTVLASGLADDESIKKNYVHTNFKLSAGGEVLALFNADGKLQDKYNIDNLPRGISIGRMAQQDGIFYFTEPTPGAANTNPSSGFVGTPMPSIPAGSYASAQTVTLSTTTQGASIYYTTDGKEPTTSSTLYTGPITMSETGMIRARAFKDGSIHSETHTATYIINATHSLPVISLVTDPDNLFDPETGIYELGPNPGSAEAFYPNANFYKDTEVPASFEVYDVDGNKVFNQNIALRMSGGLSLALREQKTFAVYARSEYGANTLAYPFFDNRPFTEYKSLLLRSGGRDDTKIKEVVALNLVDGKMNILTQAIKPYVLYVNGRYWGVYCLMEKRNKHMVAQHEGIDNPESMNLLKGSGKIVKQGTNQGYQEILDYIRSKNLVLNKEDYEYVASHMDTDSYMDLMIGQIWIGNNDPGNLQFYQILPDGKWKQAYYDFCITFQSFDTVKLRLDPSVAGTDIFNALLSYEPWKQKFIERFAWALEEIYDPERVANAIDEAADAISGEIAQQAQRFDDQMSPDEWNSKVEDMKFFAKNQGEKIVQYLKDNLSLTDEQKLLLDNAVSLDNAV